MNILVINCGSSSIKAAVVNNENGNFLLTMLIERVLDKPLIHINETAIDCPESGHEAVLNFSLPLIQDYLGAHELNGVGHRVVHGGDKFDAPVLIDETVENAIKEVSVLAPLHNPVNLLGITVARQIFDNLPHVAVFDTSFHQTMPKRAVAYALPKQLREKHELRRYGFHGTSHEYVAELAAAHLQTELNMVRIITCHLGSGASVAAVEYGRSVETSMGMTPLEGLIMGTRSGDLDPGILLHIAREEELSMNDLDQLLNKKSGLLGLSGISNDMRDIIEKSTVGDEDCRLALQVFTHRLRKYIGAYAAVMGGVDAIVFTGGIGENSPVVRHRATQRLDFLGAIINEDKNQDIKLSAEQPVQEFSMNHSRVKLLAIRTNEQFAIAKEAVRIIEEKTKVNTVPTIPIAVSGRHIHLTQEAVDALFGQGYELTEKAPLSQPGQFACNEQVTIVGPKNQIERVRVLGPTRSKNQLEISRTDEFFLGVDAPVRASGKVENTPGIKLVGPNGAYVMQEGVICAWRHIHMTPEDAQTFAVQDKDIVDVEVSNGLRPLTFGNVLVRVSPKYKLEMHIDTDEANAAELPRYSEGVLNKTERSAHLLKKKKRH
ncbi:acetate/propionate family kinase [Aureispira anguillae]|uniref:Acetate kinase n=1 Tax=Aureispira anguillae TaxID=2864201 RepID=A0A916DR89_9BACT|nr:acetate/propionate family kinase [Aureispira anguillae]BDS10076.1 acetate/propionate family kinase [Aureispira anguillae]